MRQREYDKWYSAGWVDGWANVWYPPTDSNAFKAYCNGQDAQYAERFNNNLY